MSIQTWRDDPGPQRSQMRQPANSALHPMLGIVVKHEPQQWDKIHLTSRQHAPLIATG
jgi:hypothetical protein